MENKNIEEFIWLGHEFQKNKERSLDKSFMISGIKSSFFAILIWGLSLFLFHNNIMHIFLITVSILILSPITAWFNIKNCRGRIKHIGKTKNNEVKEVSSLYKTLTKLSAFALMISGGAGLLFGRFLVATLPEDAALNLAINLISTFAVLVVLGCTYGAGICFYKVYLINKYCPHIKKHSITTFEKQQQKSR